MSKALEALCKDLKENLRPSIIDSREYMYIMSKEFSEELIEEIEALQNNEPTLEELKQSIIDICYNSKIDGCEVVYVEFYESGENVFIICKNPFGDENEIARYDEEYVLQMEWHIPLDLAHDITTYFKRLRDER